MATDRTSSIVVEQYGDNLVKLVCVHTRSVVGKEEKVQRMKDLECIPCEIVNSL